MSTHVRSSMYVIVIRFFTWPICTECIPGVFKSIHVLAFLAKLVTCKTKKELLRLCTAFAFIEAISNEMDINFQTNGSVCLNIV